MDKENWKKYIKEKHLEYKKIGYVECPAFGNEKVYFNKHGFTHLIRKKGKVRNHAEQLRRINLLKYASIILSRVQDIVSYSKNIEYGLPCYFWIFHMEVDLRKIRIVVRQLGEGRRHFFSIMDRL